MILLTKKNSLLIGDKANLYLTEEDLDYLSKDPEARVDFLESLQSEFLQVNPIVLIDSSSASFEEPVITIQSPQKIKWGCSHSLGGA